MKKIIFLVIISISFLSIDVHAYDYAIEKWDIDMVVNDNNSFDVTDNIMVQYYSQKTGIDINIPLTNDAKIKKLKINDTYKENIKDNSVELKIGSPKSKIPGAKTYSIQYNYLAGEDKNKGKDELNFNLISKNVNSTISNITFRITMPKKFNKDKLRFSYGENQELKSNELSYTVDGLTIYGRLNKILYKNDGLNVKIDLEDGYFKNSNFIYIAEYILPTLLVLIIIVFYLQYKKGNNRAEVFKKDLLTSLENRDMK